MEGVEVITGLDSEEEEGGEETSKHARAEADDVGVVVVVRATDADAEEAEKGVLRTPTDEEMAPLWRPTFESLTVVGRSCRC